jgi:hypothetical protein
LPEGSSETWNRDKNRRRNQASWHTRPMIHDSLQMGQRSRSAVFSRP